MFDQTAFDNKKGADALVLVGPMTRRHSGSGDRPSCNSACSPPFRGLLIDYNLDAECSHEFTSWSRSEHITRRPLPQGYLSLHLIVLGRRTNRIMGQSFRQVVPCKFTHVYDSERSLGRDGSSRVVLCFILAYEVALYWSKITFDILRSLQ